MMKATFDNDPVVVLGWRTRSFSGGRVVAEDSKTLQMNLQRALEEAPPCKRPGFGVFVKALEGPGTQLRRFWLYSRH